MDELLSDFLTETAENLQLVDTEIVRFERNPGDRDVLNNIFRLVHTIKGTCGFLNLPRLERLAHAAESVLGKVRDGEIAVTPEIVTATLAAIDGIKRILAALEKHGREPEGEDAAEIAQLEACMAARVPEVRPAVPASEPLPETAPRPAASIRVSVELLEQLMTSVSELVLTRNQLQQLTRGDDGGKLAQPLQRLSTQVAELQEIAMRTRMQPVSNAWGALPRMVRSLAVELDKKIELELSGGETELDRQVLELIKDPLAHMVRNAADHGIEDAATRRTLGKREAGTIRLNACQEGGHIVVSLSDDGAGIDTKRLLAKAIREGAISEAEGAASTRAQLLKLIFHPGISTADEVTAVSGRGVGMDVVRANIEKIGGAIDLDSVSGRGTTFRLRIPLTLAILPALIVSAGCERFAVPQIAVVELVRASTRGENRIETVGDASVLRLRNRLLPLVHLGCMLGGEGDGEALLDGDYVIVARAGNLTFGMVVDDIFDTEEIVVKPVPPVLADIAAYSGNAILGDGQVIMILDVNGIADECFGQHHEPEDMVPDRAAPDLAEERDSMLVFRAGGPEPKAVPLSLVSRLEEFDLDNIEWSSGRPVVQYRGDLLPLMPVDASFDLKAEGLQPALIFADGDKAIALVVDEVIDIVEDHVELKLGSDDASRLGTAIIGGRATELLDVAYYMRVGSCDRLSEQVRETSARAVRILVVDDSAFFRNMLRPLLTAAGYIVTTAASADEALRLRESGAAFDLILSDIEMPGLSGVEFAREVRGDVRWGATPLVALSSLASPQNVRTGHEAGFNRYVAKFDRTRLLETLAMELGGEVAA